MSVCQHCLKPLPIIKQISHSLQGKLEFLEKRTILIFENNKNMVMQPKQSKNYKFQCLCVRSKYFFNPILGNHFFLYIWKAIREGRLKKPLIYKIFFFNFINFWRPLNTKITNSVSRHLLAVGALRCDRLSWKRNN